MDDSSQSMQQLRDLLQSFDGRSYHHYQELRGQCFGTADYQIRFVHVQASTGAFPASVLHLLLAPAALRLPADCLTNTLRTQASADFLLRAFTAAVGQHARANRGVQGSGSFQPVALRPQVLEWNLVRFSDTATRMAFRISLPGSIDNRVLSRQAEQMLTMELPEIVNALKAAVAQHATLQTHCDTVEDMGVLQQQLSQNDLVAFVADGAVLPRRSGDSQLPLGQGAVKFRSPDDLAVHMTLPHAGRVRGLGIPKGVTVLMGGGFHGKSTLVDALAKAIYPHTPGDGREQVASHPETTFICSEQGRAVHGVNISGFMAQLPGNNNPERFWTQNASGSTSQAAAIVEAVAAGAKLLLIDEDRSATNLLIRDAQMRMLVPEEPIIPFLDRVRELYQKSGVSTLIVMGSSATYLGVADQVIAMRNYRPVSMTQQVRTLDLPEPVVSATPLALQDRRRLQAGNFDPAFRAKRLGKTVALRIKPLRLHDTLLEYGNQQLDLSILSALVDPHQVLAIGYALLLARNRFNNAGLSPSALAAALNQLIETEGLGALSPEAAPPLFLARPRQLEMAGAINRLRNLMVTAD